MWPTIQRQQIVYRRKHYATNVIKQNPVTKKKKKKKKKYIRKNLVQNGRRYSDNVQGTNVKDHTKAQKWLSNSRPMTRRNYK